MVARITTGKSIRGLLHYNENKVSAGEARLILASGFAGGINTLGVKQKLQRFTHLLDTKPSVKTNAVHISLNFHSSEEISFEKMQAISAGYMEQIGFGDQPFLVYRHEDSSHDHLHIVTTNITNTGRRIDLHDIGRKLSEPARKSIEEEFKLVKAEAKHIKNQPPIRSADIAKVRYGRQATKRAISNILTAVTRDYAFSSFSEYNAVLGQFNVRADRGEEGTAMYQRKGLLYSVIDFKGNPVGVPIKASAFYSRPTLANLEKRFEHSKAKKTRHSEDTKSKIDKAIKLKTSNSLTGLKKNLRSNGILLVERRSDAGKVYGLTYIDNYSKCVFNGSELGKSFSAKAVLEQLEVNHRTLSNSKPIYVAKSNMVTNKDEVFQSTSLLEILTEKSFDAPIDSRLKKRKKKQQQQITL